MSLPESTPSQTTEPTSPDVDVPPPALLTTRPSPAQTDQIAPEPTVPPTAVPESPKPESNTGYMQIPQELYGYIAGGASALLLGTLAWLRRQRQAPPPAAAADPDHTQDNVVTAHKSSQAETHDLASSTIEEEHEFLSDDSMFTRPNTAVDAQYDDVLYKVDVYCKYGQTTQAMALLQKEFNQQPTAHHYALRLLALYGEQQQKADIIAFVTHLNALGKNTDIAFWQDVTALVSEVCPEALNSSNDNAIANHADSNELTDFSSMAFEDPDNQEIRFGDLDPQQMLVKASADFFESSIQFEDKKATAAFGEFVFAEDDTDAQQPSTDTPHRPLPAETLIAETITADVQPLELAFTTAPDNHDLPAQIDTPLAEDTNVTPSAAPLFNVDASDNSIPFDTFDMGHATVEVLEENNTDKADSTHELTTALTLDETFNAPASPQPALAPGVDFSVPPTTSMPHEESLSRLDFDFGDFDGDDTALSLEKPQDPTMATPLSFDLDLDFGDFDAQEAHEDAQETQTLAFHAPLAEPDKPQQAPIEQVMIADDQPVSRRHETIPTDAVTHFDSTSFEVSPIDLPVAEAITTQTTQIAPEEGQHNTSAAPLFETTSFPLTKRVEEKTDDPIAYLEMSDAEFAEALAEDVLKKCQIKEQLCRQKIAQEVLNKLR
jgi:hypothetical protein